MSTKVINSRLGTCTLPSVVYIGRPGPWGNPFKIGEHGTREEVVEKFARWFATSTDPRAEWMRNNLESLRDKHLRCWCAPLPCHGDVFVAWLERTSNTPMELL
jgi:hypothetical protein